MFSFKQFLLKFKEVDATSDRRSVLYVNAKFALSNAIFNITAVKPTSLDDVDTWLPFQPNPNPVCKKIGSHIVFPTPQTHTLKLTAAHERRHARLAKWTTLFQTGGWLVCDLAFLSIETVVQSISGRLPEERNNRWEKKMAKQYLPHLL